MKQLIQNYKTGQLRIEEVPAPVLKGDGVLINTCASLISAGTERTKIETARMNLVEKAISRLDLVKVVLNNLKQEGISSTITKAFNKLNTPISLGYSCAGEVIETGGGVKEFRTGNRVACAGEIYAAHSEVNSIPHEFVVSIPENISYDEASFAGLGAIALNAVEIAQLRENENVVVIGLGLIGQIAAQIVKAKKCNILGIEVDEEKIAIIKQLGINNTANPLTDDIESVVNGFSKGNGADAVIIAAASKNNLPIEIAGRISRNKGRVILVGAMPIVLPRKDYYEKELVFMISRGFGSDLYFKEDFNRFYPYSYKSMSTKENMKSFLNLVSENKINVKPLITHRFKLEEASKAYELIKTNKEKYLGIVFNYRDTPSSERKVSVAPAPNHFPKADSGINIGFIGAGSFAQGYLLQALKKLKKTNLVAVATANGINAKSVAEKFGFEYCSTDYTEILTNDNINCVFIATRHNLHAKVLIEALKKGKNVFLEKPLCLNENELKEIISVYNRRDIKPHLLVGFNRRFSPFIVEAKEFFKNRTAPIIINYRVNAGYLPASHWVHNRQESGGRIIGEVCHFVDTLQFLTNAYPVEVFAAGLGHPDKNLPVEDNVLITIKFSDGSLGAINYNSIGDPAFPREKIEIFGGNSVAVVDNYSKASFTRSGITMKRSVFNRDMGHDDEIRSFINILQGNNEDIMPFKDIVLATLTTFKIEESLKNKALVTINSEPWIK